MIKYIILGIIQGLTEFLPVSSSAHLVIMQKVLGISSQQVVLTIVLHLGTLLALAVFFFKDILNTLRNARLVLLIIIVTAITGVIGIFGKDFFIGLFSSIRSVAFALIITGIILIMSKRFKETKGSAISIKDAVIFGLTQGFAIIPGISRSGITISTLLFRGLDRKTAFRFSFIASIPAVFGAVLLEAKDISCALNIDLKNFAIGFTASFLSGIFALYTLRIILNKTRFYYFGYYCILVALAALVFLR